MGEFITTLPADAGFYSIKSDKLNEYALPKDRSSSWMSAKPPRSNPTGYIAGSINIPIRDLLKNLDKLPAKDQKIVVNCAAWSPRRHGHDGPALTWLHRCGQSERWSTVAGSKAEFPVEKAHPLPHPSLALLPLWMQPALPLLMRT